MHCLYLTTAHPLLNACASVTQRVRIRLLTSAHPFGSRAARASFSVSNVLKARKKYQAGLLNAVLEFKFILLLRESFDRQSMHNKYLQEDGRHLQG